jgi:outer membrane protein assembly factor BamB
MLSFYYNYYCLHFRGLRYFFRSSFPIHFILTVLLLTGFPFSGNSSDSWDQFRGMGRNGYVAVPAEQMTWVESSPELLWSREIGSGFSEVVVADHTLYLMMAEKTDSVSGWETLVAMDPNNGDIIWSTRIDSVFIDVDDWGDGTRSTPAVDITTVYCFSASGKLVAIDRKDGENTLVC